MFFQKALHYKNGIMNCGDLFRAFKTADNVISVKIDISQ